MMRMASLFLCVHNDPHLLPSCHLLSCLGVSGSGHAQAAEHGSDHLI
jgi:hypothetical protein